MEIDVINALNQIYKDCEEIQKTNFINIDLDYKEDVKNFIYTAIKLSTIDNSEKGVKDFSAKFLEGYKKTGNNYKYDYYPISLKLFVKYALAYNRKDMVKDYLNAYVISIKYCLEQNGKQNIYNVESAYKLKQKIISDIQSFINENHQEYKEEDINAKDTTKDKVETQVNKEELNNEDVVENLLKDLNSLIGLANVKKEVKKRINQIRVDKKRQEAGLKKTIMSLHLVFTGNPGTGKTTVARKLAAIYKELGVLSGGQFIEVDRSALVGAYVGSTAIKTQEIINKALGGILFIDEAYTLSHNKGENDFGQEAIDTLLKAMEDHRDDFVVIVAGYSAEMEEFINSNPGLQSRFNRYIEFEDYSAEELYDIFKLTAKNDEKIIHEECNDYLKKYFEKMVLNKTKNFANGRSVRNYYENVIESLNERLIEDLDHKTKEDLQTIRLVDLEKITN